MNHYASKYTGGPECIEVMRGCGIDMESYFIGCIIKYLFRYKNKGDAAGDLGKAREYIDFLIEEQDDISTKG